jgi:hypothetical protein
MALMNKRLFDVYKSTLLTTAIFISFMSLEASQAQALAGSGNSGLEAGTTNGSGPGSSPTRVSAGAGRAASTHAPRACKKAIKMRYGKLLRSKPADPSNFGLLKSYTSHPHGRRWNSKQSGV